MGSYQNAQGCQGGIRRIIDLEGLNVTKWKKNIEQTSMHASLANTQENMYATIEPNGGEKRKRRSRSVNTVGKKQRKQVEQKKKG